MLPSLFLSHGSPMLALTASPARDFLSGLAARLERPQAILVASAHWETRSPALSAPAVNETIYDFYGFPPELYEKHYPAPGSPELAKLTVETLGKSHVGLDTEWGLDHGAWAVLCQMYPRADVPVVQLSLDERKPPAYHY
ncbi:MAG: dioxygenase, partial [Rhodospirillales bacterium]|nr:dioxygenase [Rhodospirillales bacterium]